MPLPAEVGSFSTVNHFRKKCLLSNGTFLPMDLLKTFYVDLQYTYRKVCALMVSA